MIGHAAMLSGSLTMATPAPWSIAPDRRYGQASTSSTRDMSDASHRSEAQRDLAEKLDKLANPPGGFPAPPPRLLQRARDYLTSAMFASLARRHHWPRPFLAFGDDIVAEWSGEGWSLTIFFGEDDEGVFWVRSPGEDPDGSEEGVLDDPDDFIELLDWMAERRAHR